MNTISTVFDELEARVESEKFNSSLDRITIRDYIKEVEIGAFQVERDLTQRLKFNVVVEVSAATSSISDDVDDILSYDMIIEAIDEQLDFERLNLLETLAERVSTQILSHKQAERVFMRIEKDLIKFIKVKFIISLFTGLGFSLACYAFGVSFPIFWGLFAFSINFVQMVGSVISIASLSLFAFIELDPTGILLFFILTITLVQLIMGGVLEPIFMGKSFSINVITILVMLMFWGFLWGVPGMILCIPITVFLKIILEQFPKTKFIADLMTGSEPIQFKKLKRKPYIKN